MEVASGDILTKLSQKLQKKCLLVGNLAQKAKLCRPEKNSVKKQDHVDTLYDGRIYRDLSRMRTLAEMLPLSKWFASRLRKFCCASRK